MSDSESCPIRGGGDGDDSDATIDKLVNQTKSGLTRTLSRGKSFTSEMSESSQIDLLYHMTSADVDEKLHDLNIILGKGNEDFDFRNLNHQELMDVLRWKPTRETFSNVGNMMKVLYPQKVKQDNVTSAQALKKNKVT